MSAVAFLGLGRMGLPMAVNLVSAGHDLTVWNRTPAKAEAFAAEHGATTAPTPRDAATGAAYVITMLADDAALLEAHRGPEGILSGLTPGAIAIDMSTVSPETIVELAAEVRAAGGELVDAPEDLLLALRAAERAGAELPQTTLNLDVLQDAVRAGYGDLDESGVAEFLRASGPATPAPISRLSGTVEGIRSSTS